MAVVIDFPVKEAPRRSCEDCENAYQGAAGVFCRLYNEEIWNTEKVARECEDWDPVPWVRDV